MQEAILLVQRWWRKVGQRRKVLWDLRREVMWDQGVELLQEEECRYGYFLLTDAIMDGEGEFYRRRLHFDNLAQLWNLPELDDVRALSSVPCD